MSSIRINKKALISLKKELEKSQIAIKENLNTIYNSLSIASSKKAKELLKIINNNTILIKLENIIMTIDNVLKEIDHYDKLTNKKLSNKVDELYQSLSFLDDYKGIDDLALYSIEDSSIDENTQIIETIDIEDYHDVDFSQLPEIDFDKLNNQSKKESPVSTKQSSLPEKPIKKEIKQEEIINSKVEASPQEESKLFNISLIILTTIMIISLLIIMTIYIKK